MSSCVYGQISDRQPLYRPAASHDSDSGSKICSLAESFFQVPLCQWSVFHVYAGSQVLDASDLIGHLRGAFEISCRAADMIGISPDLMNLGGGFGIPYAPQGKELDLSAVGQALADIVQQASPTRIVLELGRYLVAQAGWYLTSVLGHQTNLDRPAVIVDGGTHQRADLCGLCLCTNSLPPVALGVSSEATTKPTDVLGLLEPSRRYTR